MRRICVALASSFAFVALVAVPGNAFAAHNGNSKAELTGTGDPDAQGTALVNYSKGEDDYNAQVLVFNLDPGETYEYRLRRTDGTEVTVCGDTANDQGTFTCSGQHIEFSGLGFTGAAVYDSSNTQVAAGGFPLDRRRGNCRDPDQAFSQCEHA
jgi:hypothetical protein